VSLFFSDLGGIFHVSEHVQLCCNTKNKSFLERRSPGVDMGVNQSRQQRVTGRVNDADSRRYLDLCPHSLDCTVLDPDIALLNHARPIKDTCIANDKFIVAWSRRLRECANG